LFRRDALLGIYQITLAYPRLWTTHAGRTVSYRNSVTSKFIHYLPLPVIQLLLYQPLARRFTDRAACGTNICRFLCLAAGAIFCKAASTLTESTPTKMIPEPQVHSTQLHSCSAAEAHKNSAQNKWTNRNWDSSVGIATGLLNWTSEESGLDSR
jgi:hypothetical protein